MTDSKKQPSGDRLLMRWRGAPIVNLDRDFLDMAGAKRRINRINIGVKKDLDLNNTIPADIRARLDIPFNEVDEGKH